MHPHTHKITNQLKKRNKNKTEHIEHSEVSQPVLSVEAEVMHVTFLSLNRILELGSGGAHV